MIDHIIDLLGKLSSSPEMRLASMHILYVLLSSVSNSKLCLTTRLLPLARTIIFYFFKLLHTGEFTCSVSWNKLTMFDIDLFFFRLRKQWPINAKLSSYISWTFTDSWKFSSCFKVFAWSCCGKGRLFVLICWAFFLEYFYFFFIYVTFILFFKTINGCFERDKTEKPFDKIFALFLSKKGKCFSRCLEIHKTCLFIQYDLPQFQ